MRYACWPLYSVTVSITLNYLDVSVLLYRPSQGVSSVINTFLVLIAFDAYDQACRNDDFLMPEMLLVL